MNALAAPMFVVMDQALSDYTKVQDVLQHLHDHWNDQPSTEELAEKLHMDPQALQRLFTRWAGLTPKAFLQALTLDHAKRMLSDSASVLDATFEAGLSAPSRLHDLFVTHEAMPPGVWKNRGEGVCITFGWHPSPFGLALIMTTPWGLCGLSFADEAKTKIAFADMAGRWPNAAYVENSAATAPVAAQIFGDQKWQANAPLRVTMIGTDFEIRVWETLLKIPMGKATTYGTIAAHVGSPKAARAVGAAVGKNPISFVVPCHRVIGRDGALTGYHWGLNRKRAMLGWEAGKVSQD
jgi:AraC family transcriptional regulator, regulatory protein of adaptative response / methylated-DNA-[protein]-cysteine methyltransferase